MAPKTIAVIGAMFAELVMISDRYPDRGESLLGEEFYEGPGGKGANAAIATYRSSHANPATLHNDSGSLVAAAEPANQQDDDLKINVRMVGAVANDKYGNDLQAALKSTGVDCSGVMVFEGPGDRTGVAFCMVDNVTRDNRCLFHRGVTARWQRLDFKNAIDLGHGVVPDLCVAQMEIHPDVVQQMIETAGAAKIDFVLNAAPAGTIEYHTYKWITHLIVNETEAAILSGLEVDEVHEKSWESVCLDFLNRGVKNVVITLSEKGAYYANADKRGHCPGYKVLVEDTTGAGYVLLFPTNLLS